MRTLGFAAWERVPAPIIGMLHLPPLPGAPNARADLPTSTDFVLRDAAALAEGGAHGLLLENFGDIPFYPGSVPPYVISMMTAVAVAVRSRFDLPLGINVLRNDALAALSVAHAAGADFVRVNVLCGARVTDQGLIQGPAHELLRTRKILNCERVRIFADVDVKHSAPLGIPRPIADEAADLVGRGGAEALVLSGAGTGRPTDAAHVQQVRAAAPRTPVFVGSGVTPETIRTFLPHANGFIVGSALKRDGIITSPIDRARVAALIAAVA